MIFKRIIKKLSKAVRHLYDALYYRSVNNELDYIENNVVKRFWKVANSQTWNTFLWFVTAIY